MERLLADGVLFKLLERLDWDLALAIWAMGCVHCGARLHRSDYARKPRGLASAVLSRWDSRYSFCCGKEGCRKRHTPPSVRFLGRKVYAGVVVVLVSALMHGASPRRVEKLRCALGIDARTLRHWRRWWRERFVSGGFWKAERARFMPPVEEARMPRGLVEAFGAQERDGLLRLMRFLSAITARSSAEVAAM